jgi:TRAP-type mannitol/chloroaromatic compound transport system substrate-binding protein
MDRRDFLTGSAVAAAGSAVGVAALPATVEAGSVPVAPDLHAPRRPAPARAHSGDGWRLAVPLSVAHPEVLTAAHRLAHGLTQVLGHGGGVQVETTGEAGLEAVMGGRADFYLGLDAAAADRHPGLHVTSGLPLGAAVPMALHLAWLTAGDGADLLEELAGRFDAVVRPAFVTGPSSGLLTDRLLDGVADFGGLRLACHGLAREVVAALGARVVEPEERAPGALAAQGIDAVEPLIGAPIGVAHWSYQPGLLPGGVVLSLGMRAGLWSGLGPSGQAAIDGLAARTLVRSQADAEMRAATLRQVASLRRWPVATAFSPALERALAAATRSALERLAEHDALAARLVQSHTALRESVSPLVASGGLLA